MIFERQSVLWTLLYMPRDQLDSLVVQTEVFKNRNTIFIGAEKGCFAYPIRCEGTVCTVAYRPPIIELLAVQMANDEVWKIAFE